MKFRIEKIDNKHVVLSDDNDRTVFGRYETKELAEEAMQGWIAYYEDTYDPH